MKNYCTILVESLKTALSYYMMADDSSLPLDERTKSAGALLQILEDMSAIFFEIRNDTSIEFEYLQIIKKYADTPEEELLIKEYEHTLQENIIAGNRADFGPYRKKLTPVFGRFVQAITKGLGPSLGGYLPEIKDFTIRISLDTCPYAFTHELSQGTLPFVYVTVVDADHFSEYVGLLIEKNEQIKNLTVGCTFHSFDDGYKNGVAFAQALSKNTSLYSIDLSFYPFGDSSIDAFLMMFEKNKTLRRIFLGSCGFTDTGGKKFLKLLEIDSSITFLDLSGNKFSFETRQELLQLYSQKGISIFL